MAILSLVPALLAGTACTSDLAESLPEVSNTGLAIGFDTGKGGFATRAEVADESTLREDYVDHVDVFIFDGVTGDIVPNGTGTCYWRVTASEMEENQTQTQTLLDGEWKTSPLGGTDYDVYVVANLHGNGNLSDVKSVADLQAKVEEDANVYQAQGGIYVGNTPIQDLDKSLWHVKGHGEDWEGLRREVEKRPGLLKQAEVLRIIDECGDDRDACEARFKALNPPEIYQRLLNEMYGPLRRNEYRIEYNVRHYNQEEARQLLKTRPDLLSVAEIHRVADSYGRGTEDYLRALKTAVDTWPEDKAALNNYALALLDAGRYDAVVALLQQRAGQDGSLINLMGVAYYKAGRLDEAQEAFQKAADAGCADARSNLSQLVQARAMLGK